jgi:histidyl-tRNA synthetase
VKIGSICGGGRYDNLTGIFGLPDVSGIGISFGADRIYDVLNELNLYPESKQFGTKLMFVNFGDKEAKHCLKLITKIREHGISSELFPDSSKMKKQMNYANTKGISYVALIGESEIEQNMITLKNMQSGEQNMITIEELIQELS